MKKMLVSILLSYFRFFARIALQRSKPTVIGITGSAGKSSARTMLYTILKDHFPTEMVFGNSEVGIPLGILGLKNNSLGFETPLSSIFDWLRLCTSAPLHLNYLKGTKYLIVEMGIDDPYPPKNMEYLLTIVKPDIAVCLNVGAAHTMQFEKLLPHPNPPTPVSLRSQAGSLRPPLKGEGIKGEEKVDFLIQKIAEEKAKIITRSGCKIGIYNADNAYILQALSHVIPAHAGIQIPDQVGDDIKLLSFGQSSKNSISYRDYNVSLTGTTFTFSLKNLTNQTDLKTIIPDYLLPQEYQETIAAVILAALQTGLNNEQIKQSLERNFSLPKSRATMLKGIHDSIIIDSSYNASRIAVEGMLDLLTELKKHPPAGGKRPVVFLFGDMRELGEEAKIEHEKVAQKLIGVVDYLYCVGPLTRQYVLPTYNLGLMTYNLHEVRWFDTAVRAGEYLKDNLPKNALILVKGSQNTIYLEEAIKYILADKKDEKKLCRQEEYWTKKKA